MAAMKAMKAVKAMKAMKAMKMKGSDEDSCSNEMQTDPPEAYEPVQAMKAMKKRGSGMHRDRVFLKRTTKSLKRIEQEFWRKLKSRLKHEVAAEYEQTIQNLKQRLASEVLAEFDFCRLFPWPPVSIHFICMGGRSHIPEGLGLEAGPLDGKMMLVIIRGFWLCQEKKERKKAQQHVKKLTGKSAYLSLCT